MYGPWLVVVRWFSTTWFKSPELVPSRTTADWPAAGPEPPDPAPAADPLFTLSSPDCTPPDVGEAESSLTSVNDGLVKHAAYAPSFWKSATVKGPRTSVRTLCQAPEPRLVPAGPGGAPESWLWQLASAADDGAAAVVGVALHPA